MTLVLVLTFLIKFLISRLHLLGSMFVGFSVLWHGIFKCLLLFGVIIHFIIER